MELACFFVSLVGAGVVLFVVYAALRHVSPAAIAEEATRRGLVLEARRGWAFVFRGAIDGHTIELGRRARGSRRGTGPPSLEVRVPLERDDVLLLEPTHRARARAVTGLASRLSADEAHRERLDAAALHWQDVHGIAVSASPAGKTLSPSIQQVVMTLSEHLRRRKRCPSVYVIDGMLVVTSRDALASTQEILDLTLAVRRALAG